MGKSKRIRADRARDTVANPEKYEKDNSARKAKVVSIVLIAIIAAILISTIALVVFSKTGSILRGQIVYRSDNFEINGTMAKYMYYYTYNLYYSMYGQLTSYLVSEKTITDSAKSMLALCEAAKADGMELEDHEIKRINDSIASIKKELSEAGISVSAAYGNCGVSYDDIRKVLELQTLSSKYSSAKQEEYTNKYVADPDAVLKYFEENRKDFQKGGYIKISTKNEEWRTELKKATSAEALEKTYIGLYVDATFDEKFKADDLEDADKLTDAQKTDVIKAVKNAIAYILYEIKEDGVKYGDSDDIDEALMKSLLDGKEISAKAMTAITTATKELKSGVSSSVTVSSSTAYPSPTTTAATTTTKTPDTTTDAPAAQNNEETTTADDTTTKSDETTDKTAVSLNDFQKWFFDDERKDKDFYTDDNAIYFVTTSAALDHTKTKNVGHILVKVDRKTASSTATDAEKKQIEEDNNKAYAEKKPEAEKIRDEFLAGTKSKDAFEALANKYTEDSGVFYYNVTKGTMVTEFEDWIYAEARKEGDVDIVKTDYGYHIMYFLGDGVETWQAKVIDSMVSKDMTELNKALADKYKVTVANASQIVK